MPELPLEDFDEVRWNEERHEKEDVVIESIHDLCNFMGSNKFSLKDGAYTISVKVDHALLD